MECESDLNYFKLPYSESLFIFTLWGVFIGAGLVIKDKTVFFKIQENFQLNFQNGYLTGVIICLNVEKHLPKLKKKKKKKTPKITTSEFVFLTLLRFPL